jgi:hypothetical protein
MIVAQRSHAAVEALHVSGGFMPPGRPRKNNDDVLLKSADLIGWAIGGLEREISQTRETLAKLMAQAAQLRSRSGSKAGTGPGAAAGSGARASVAESGDSQPAVKGRKRRRRTMSPEARKRISEMMKKRWAERRKAR